MYNPMIIEFYSMSNMYKPYINKIESCNFILHTFQARKLNISQKQKVMKRTINLVKTSLL